MPILWYIISEETREKLKILLPKSWRPPQSDDRHITLTGEYPDLEEIDKTIRQRPHHMKRVI